MNGDAGALQTIKIMPRRPPRNFRSLSPYKVPPGMLDDPPDLLHTDGVDTAGSDTPPPPQTAPTTTTGVWENRLVWLWTNKVTICMTFAAMAVIACVALDYSTFLSNSWSEASDDVKGANTSWTACKSAEGMKRQVKVATYKAECDDAKITANRFHFVHSLLDSFSQYANARLTMSWTTTMYVGGSVVSIAVIAAVTAPFIGGWNALYRVCSYLFTSKK